MLKTIYYFTHRFKQQNLKKTVPLYLLTALILAVYGVKGLMLSFMIIFFYVMGWMSHKCMAFIRDYRLSRTLDRVHFSQAEFELLKRENKLLFDALQSHMKTNVRDGVGGGVKTGQSRRYPTAPPPRMSREDLEEMELRYRMEEDER